MTGKEEFRRVSGLREDEKKRSHKIAEGIDWKSGGQRHKRPMMQKERAMMFARSSLLVDMPFI
jgi:hypothetical protein